MAQFHSFQTRILIMRASVENEQSLTHAVLRSLLHYDKKTGLFTWLVDRPRARAGSVAGCLMAEGYIRIKINGRNYLAQRLAHFWVKGKWPSKLVDHEDRDRSNNKWTNIRSANHSQNARNCPVKRNSASGIKGVAKKRTSNRWEATIRVNGSKMYLGLYKTKEEAATAYRLAAEKHHCTFACAV